MINVNYSKCAGSYVFHKAIALSKPDVKTDKSKILFWYSWLSKYVFQFPLVKIPSWLVISTIHTKQNVQSKQALCEGTGLD